MSEGVYNALFLVVVMHAAEVMTYLAYRLFREG